MNEAIALLVGLKRVDPNAPEYTSLKDPERKDGIRGCELDVGNMERLLLDAGGFVIHKLLTTEATSKSILDHIALAATSLDAGDLFVFFFSGHGDQVRDDNGDERDDHKDEALAAYDRRIIDDELPPLWTKFRPGVRILMISDTCNSGTNFRGPAPRIAVRAEVDAPLQIDASLIHIAATHDSTDTPGGPTGGDFTNALLKVWNHGSFQGSYHEFFDQTKKTLQLQQNGAEIRSQPVFSQVGPSVDTFVREQPFVV